MVKHRIDVLGAALLVVAYLISPGDNPWISFWREWTASVGVLAIVLYMIWRVRLAGGAVSLAPLSLPGVALALAVVAWLQWATGLLPYHGDALIVSAMLVGFALCIAFSQALETDERERLADLLAWAMLTAALVSAALAVAQWVGVLRLDMDRPIVAGRPIAHMEQTNLLCSLLLQGLFGAWRLRERGRLGSRVDGLCTLVLAVAMALTQSRVAWLVIVAAAVAWAWRRRTLVLASGGARLLVVACVLVVGVVLVPKADEWLGFTGLSVADRFSGGRRPDVWGLFLDAVAQRPWAGWGVLQNCAAQFELADRHPLLYWTFSSAHDIVLDLMVWFGAPLGLLAGGALLFAVLRRVARARDGATFVVSLAAAAPVIHALVELPLHYTYFLFPLGLWLGLSTPSGAPARWRLAVRGPGWHAAVGLGAVALLAALARTYPDASVGRPVLAAEKTAHHMVVVADPPPPGPALLDQLQAFQAFIAIPVDAKLDAAELDAQRVPLLRYPYAPTQEHAARLFAHNGRVDEARAILKRECLFITPPQCAESRRAWAQWQASGEPLPDWPAP